MKHPLSKNTPAIRDPFIRVGTINKAVAKAAKIQAADIYINRNYRAHIRNRHAAEYEQAGLDVVTYARTICQNFNQIRATGKAVDEIKEAVSTINYYEVAALSKGDIIYECFKRRSVKTRIISDLLKGEVELSLTNRWTHRILTQ